MQTILTPPPSLAMPLASVAPDPLLAPPLAPPLVPPSAPITPPIAPIAPPLQFTWMQESDWQRTPSLIQAGLHNTTGWSGAYGCVRWHHTGERAAAAGFEGDEWHLPSAVRKAERRCDPEVAQREKEVDARRQRVRRIEEEKEDCDALP